ncbi:MAG TPA: hypothetical protein VLB51_18435 [Methylomirabilota bacterium]|nr:hypothetical protein [Methylomirabilota bacterium]
MTGFNAAVGTVIDWLQAPLAGLPPLVGVALWSVPVAVFALWVFGKTSNQARIAEVKRRIAASLFEIRLFNDDLRAIARAQWEILGHVVRYQGLALVPMVFILPPLVVLMVHLHQFYGFRGLAPGEHALLRVELAEAGSARPEMTVDVPSGLSLATPALWVPALGELNWELAADAPGDYELAFTIGGTSTTKAVRVTDRVVRLSPERPPHAFVDQLEWPSEPPLPPEGPIRRITVDYPEGAVGLLGWSWQWAFAWMVVFFVLTMVFAVVLKGRMGVEL